MLYVVTGNIFSLYSVSHLIEKCSDNFCGASKIAHTKTKKVCARLQAACLYHCQEEEENGSLADGVQFYMPWHVVFALTSHFSLLSGYCEQWIDILMDNLCGCFYWSHIQTDEIHGYHGYMEMSSDRVNWINTISNIVFMKGIYYRWGITKISHLLAHENVTIPYSFNSVQWRQCVMQ